MTQKKIVVEIDKEGNARIEAIGFTGPACEAATKFVEEALGGKVSRNKKKEYTQRVQGNQGVSM